METVASRLTAFIDSLGISKNEFARQIGTSSSVISHITSQDVSFRIDILLKILSKFQTINIEWLLTGSGKMTKEIQQEISNTIQTRKQTQEKTDTLQSVGFQFVAPEMANELEKIISNQITAIKFHIEGIHHHLEHLKPGHKSADKLRSELERIEQFIDEMNGNTLKREKPKWERVSADEKIELISIFEAFIKGALDRIYDITRDIYSDSLTAKSE